ncbi:hypothetical protein H9P43_004739 [Blastocladiella emersonii ATCC 22665]|nr:hypothetical protein H9P43_004739 [Blastocladiella emersonii ATCC 22665]
MFSKVTATFYIHLAPKFVGSPMRGVEDHLNHMLLRFSDKVGGVVLSYSNVEFLTDRAPILYDSPFMHFHISADLLVFAPKVGSTIRGVVNKQSPTHIGLLVFNLFNVSIATADIPSDVFAFHADESAAAPAAAAEHEYPGKRHRRGPGGAAAAAAALAGNWVHTESDVLIEVGTELEFAVTEVLKSHDFVNIKGSLVDVPFTPAAGARTHAEFTAANAAAAAATATFDGAASAAASTLITFGDDDEEEQPQQEAEEAEAAVEEESKADEAEEEEAPKRKRKRSADAEAEAEPAAAAAEEETSSKKSKKSSKKEKSAKKSSSDEKATKKRKKSAE